MTKSEKIAELSGLWGKCLVDLHKNSDTQHFIYTKYCFGGTKYIVEHYGYVYSPYNESFYTLNAAQNYLIGKLCQQIQEECDHQLYALDRLDEYDTNKDKDYWNKILNELEITKNLSTNDAEPKINEEEYHEMERKYNGLKYDYDLCEELLNKNNVPKFSPEYPEMLYSLNYRLELLIKRLRNEKT